MTSWLARWRKRRSQRICQDAQRRIQEIVDGEVPSPRERQRLERHIGECPPCGAEAGTVRELKQAISRVGARPDPAVQARLAALVDDIRCGRLGDAEREPPSPPSSG